MKDKDDTDIARSPTETARTGDGPASTRPVDAHIIVLGLSGRAYSRLHSAGIQTLARLQALNDRHVMALPNMAPVEMHEIRQALESHLQEHPERRVPLPSRAQESQPEELPAKSLTSRLYVPDPTLAEQLTDTTAAAALANAAPVQVLGFPVETLRCLERAELNSVAQLASCTDKQLLLRYGLDRNSLGDVKRRLSTYVATPPELRPVALPDQAGEVAEPPRAAQDEGGHQLGASESCRGEVGWDYATALNQWIGRHKEQERQVLAHRRGTVEAIGKLHEIGQKPRVSTSPIQQLEDEPNQILDSSQAQQEVSAALRDRAEDLAASDGQMTEEDDAAPTKTVDAHIIALGLSGRAYTRLRSAGIRTLALLQILDDDQLMALPNMSQVEMHEIKQALELHLDEHPERRINLLLQGQEFEPEGSPGECLDSPERDPEELLAESCDSLEYAPDLTVAEQATGTAASAVLNDNSPIQALGLSVHTFRCFVRAGILRIAQLGSRTDEQLLSLPGLGRRSLVETKSQLSAYLATQPELRPVALSDLVDEPAEVLGAVTGDDLAQGAGPESCPISVLDLRSRTENTLRRVGIETLVHLQILTDEQLMDVRNLGPLALQEIRHALETYLRRRPDHRFVLSPQASLLNMDEEPQEAPCIAAESVHCVTSATLMDQTSIGVLQLSTRSYRCLARAGIDTVGQLAAQTDEQLLSLHNLGYTSLAEIKSKFSDYLVRPPGVAPADEVCGKAALEMPPGAEDVYAKDLCQWLSRLKGNERPVLERRLGLAEGGRTLQEIGKDLGVSRSRIQQVEARALKRLSSASAQQGIVPVIASMEEAFAASGGLMTEEDVRQHMVGLTRWPEPEAALAAGLLLQTSAKFKETAVEQIWGLADKPLDLVAKVQAELLRLIKSTPAPASRSALVARFLSDAALDKRFCEVDEPFVDACLRTHPRKELIDQAAATDIPARARPPETAPRTAPTGPGPSPELDAWEARLAPQVRQVELLGEILITPEERTRLGQAIGRLFLKSSGRRKGMAIMRERYRCCLATFMVAQGLYGYEGGNYWDGVFSVTRYRNASADFGQAFVEIVEELGLPIFPDLIAAGAQPRVSLILAHGGIPRYCLPDFFDHMLQPALHRPQYAGMTASELINEWNRHSAGLFVDKPVLRFLVHGGRVAEDFVQRCLELARESSETGLVPQATDIGLPSWVVESYEEWAREHGTAVESRSDQWRLRKPRIVVDPWGLGVHVELPPQQLPAAAAQSTIVWQVEADRDKHQIHVQVRKSGLDWKSSPESRQLTRPSEGIQVSLLVDDQVMRIWQFVGVGADRPLLAFEPESGSLVQWQRSLPVGQLGLLFPEDTQLRIQGGSAQVELLPRLPWDWRSYRGEVWQLEEGSTLGLFRGDRELLLLPVRQDDTGQRPRLAGGSLFSPGVEAAEPPLYVGCPPRVRIPLSGRLSPEEEMSRWRISVRNRWPAVPTLHLTKRLDEIADQLVPGDGFVDVPLDHTNLLGDAPMGGFSIRLRGPLGRDAELALRILPELIIAGQNTLYLPDPKTGPPPAMLQVRIGTRETLECRTVGGDFQIRALPGGQDYEISADPTATSFELAVAQMSASRETVRVPVSVRVRRLEWTLLSAATAGTTTEWSGRAVSLLVDALMQQESPCLAVRLPLADAHSVGLVLRLRDSAGCLLQAAQKAASSRTGSLWRFELSEFMGTIRQSSHSSVLHLELEATGLKGNQGPMIWPAIVLTHAVSVQNVSLRQGEGDGGQLVLKWHEGTSLKNLAVRIWSLWRPWQPVFVRYIPDADHGETLLRDPQGELPPGAYRVEFFIQDPWVAPLDAPGMPQAGGAVFDVETAPVAVRLASLNADLASKSPPFDLMLERAVLRRAVGQFAASRRDCRWCSEHLDEAPVDLVLALYRLVRDDGDQALQEKLQSDMFNLASIRRLVREYEQGRVTRQKLSEYLGALAAPTFLGMTACKLLLIVPDDRVRLTAVERLVRHNEPEGVEAILEWARVGTMSDADAVAMLERNAIFSRNILLRHSDDPSALRLLESILKGLGEVGRVLRQGYWILCRAGWGRIDRIEDASGRQAELFLRGQSGFRLSVTLRPRAEGERVVIDLDAGTISFEKAETMWRCTKCDFFASRESNQVQRQHETAAHGNMRPGMCPVPNPMPLGNPVFSLRGPQDEYGGYANEPGAKNTLPTGGQHA
jgi:DNA-directed RNA polymerase alpha subunit